MPLTECFSALVWAGNPLNYVHRAIDYIKAEHPRIWARHGGRDHIFLALGAK